MVARAIYDSEIPVISAVGHEIDFTISDFVADMRAPTPSAAAEIAVPSQIELAEKFNNVYNRLYQQAHRIIERSRLMVENNSERQAFKNPMLKVNEERMYLDRVQQDLKIECERTLESKKQELQVLISRLDGLSPLGALARGFSVTKDKEGRLVRSVTQAKKGDSLEILVEDGRIRTMVTDTENKY